jgi:hypothetical protein
MLAPNLSLRKQKRSFAASASSGGHQCRTKKECHQQERDACRRPLPQYAIGLLDQPAKGRCPLSAPRFFKEPVQRAPGEGAMRPAALQRQVD